MIHLQPVIQEKKKSMIFTQGEAPPRASKYSTVRLASAGFKVEQTIAHLFSSLDLNRVDNS